MSGDGLARLRHVAHYRPLVEAWRTAGPTGAQPLTTAESDLVTLAIEALDVPAPLAIALPGGRSRIPLLAAVAAAAEPLTRPHQPRSPGAVAFVTRSALRRVELDALDAAGVPVATALQPRRLRGDGYVCRPGGGGVGELTSSHHLLFASPASGLIPPRGETVRAVIVDDSDDPAAELSAAAARWAGDMNAAVVAFTHLAAAPPLGWHTWRADWPELVANGLAAGLDAGATAASGGARAVVVADARIAPLFAVRAILARLADRPAPWPAALRAAARFARVLVDLPVPADLYDAHVPGTIARSLTRRRDELDDTSPAALDGPWRDVAETDWAHIKANLGAAHDAIVDVNHKANALGLTVEDLLAAGETVDVMCPSGVAAAATLTWLLEGGFAGITAAVAAGRLDIRAIGRSAPWAQQQATVLTGLPAHRHQHRVADGDVGRLLVCCYPREAARLAELLDRTLNSERVTNAVCRSATLATVAGAPGGTVPPRIAVTVAHTEAAVAAELEPADFVDIAEAAALDGLLDDDGDNDDVDEEEDGPSRPAWVPARALIVEPAMGGEPIGLLVRETAVLDRVTQGRVSPIRPASLAPGMLVVGVTGEARQGIFSRLRPHLDILQGPGTRLWLGLWQQALRQALRRTGSPTALADALRARGATIRNPAVAAWSSPYRIGPRDARNVRRVAEIAGVDSVAVNTHTIAAVMGGVRRRHRDIGTRLSAALRAAATGRPDAFDRLETQLGADVAELLGDVTPWRVLSVSTDGWVPPTSLWRPLAPAAAHAAFRTDLPDVVTGAGDSRPAITSEEPA